MQVAFLVDAHDIPPELVANSDQTAVCFVNAPVYQWTKKGAKDVSVAGFGDKRQITANPATTAAGGNLPLQVGLLDSQLLDVC